MAVTEFSAHGVPRSRRDSALRWLLSHVARQWPFVVGALLIYTLSHIAYAGARVAIGQAAEVVMNPASGSLLRASLLVLGLLLFDGVAILFGSYAIEIVAKRVARDGRLELYADLLGKSQTFHDRQRVGDLMARATDDVEQISAMFTPGLSLLIESGLALLVPLVYIALIDGQMLLVPLLFVVALAVALRGYSRQLDPVTTAQRAAFGALNSRLEETISGIEVVKASARELFERSVFGSRARRYRDLYVRQGEIEARYLPLLLFGIAFGLTFGHALLRYRAGAITIPDVIAIMGLMGILRFPTFISIFTFALVQLGMASARRILSILNAESEVDENPRGHSAPMRGAIRFEGVSFSYEGADVLHDLSFEIEAGQTVAIVGQTGSGKSTLVQLVNRTYDATAGRVLVDGVDVRDWNLDALRSQISKIEQDIFLFSRTIRENIAFGKPDATQAEIEAAARAAQAHNFIMGFQGGYESEVGERGVTLSGGQRQRLALARAFLGDPRILILDDSTSAVDSATEDEIQRALREAERGRTVLLITHRLAQIRWADLILVLDGGTIVAAGRHEELLRRSLPYRRIFARYDIELPPLEAA